MSWTTISDLTMTNYQAGKVLDATKFHNDAQLLGPVLTQPGFVSFQGGDAQLEILVRDESLQRFTAIRVEPMQVQALVRNDPLNVSMWQLSVRFPGRLKSIRALVMVRPKIEQPPRKFAAVINKKILGGEPRRAASRFNAATTCSLRKR